jgi:HD superfamily phosphohydrolase
MPLTIQDTLHSRQIVFDDTREGLLFQALVNSAEFNRLKNIQQISYSSNAYRQATHTRDIHSLGVYYIADQILGRIQEQHPKTYDAHEALIVRIRALLHDIGHGPKSHSWEGIMNALGHNQGHEEWGHHIVSGDTEVGNILRQFDERVYQDVRESFLREEPASFWDTIIASQLDADRLDYLQRDARNTGIKLGINEAYVLGSVKLAHVGANDDICLAFDPKSEVAIMQILQSRTALYRSVSYNKHSESSDALMRHIFAQAQRLFREHGPESLGFNPEDHHIKVIMAEPDQVAVEDYLYLDDNVLHAFLKKMASNTDPRLEVLARQAQLLSSSKPLHVVDFLTTLPDKSKRGFERAKEIFDELGGQHQGHFSGTFIKRQEAYKRTGNPFNQIWLSNGGSATDIGDVMTVPDDIIAGCAFSESLDLISAFKQALLEDQGLKTLYGSGYGIPPRAVPAPNMI